MYATFWSLVPPIAAILLALITKEVYSSLFVGIVVGFLFLNNFNVIPAFTSMVEEGFVASVADSWNVGILLFLVVLGAIVILLNKVGGSAAYANWACNRIKSKRGAQLATVGLGTLIFVDDYFNCLTVGSVMRPVTDKFKVSRAKLAYIIDATAAPICMIAPISSWAAAVTGVVEGYDGIDLFIRAIPYNLYSLLALGTVVLLIVFKIDFGPMRQHEINAENGDLYTSGADEFKNVNVEPVTTKGRVYDLVIPVVVLIISCVAGMVYTGGFFGGVPFVEAFGGCDASLGLSMGSIVALAIIIIYYMLRRVLSFAECMESIPAGFKAMVPSILILIFAWTLSGVTKSLGAPEFVSGIFASGAESLEMFLPVIVFLVAALLAFSTGTSWGSFGILLPIVVGVSLSGELLVIAVSACLAGAVCGDHCSPISDTTIMSSAGAQSNHINHVVTQLPYVLLVAAISAVGYILAGILQNALSVLAICFGILIVILGFIRFYNNKQKQ